MHTVQNVLIFICLVTGKGIEVGPVLVVPLTLSFSWEVLTSVKQGPGIVSGAICSLEDAGAEVGAVFVVPLTLFFFREPLTFDVSGAICSLEDEGTEVGTVLAVPLVSSF